MSIRIPSPEYDERLIAAPFEAQGQTIFSKEERHGDLGVATIESPHMTFEGRLRLAKLFASVHRLQEQNRLYRETLEVIGATGLEEDGEDALWERDGSESEEVLVKVTRIARATLETAKQEAGVTMAEHTPGPWHYEAEQGEVHSLYGSICTVHGFDNPDDETVPNAKLIASAPQLQEQVRILREALEQIGDMSKVRGRWLLNEECVSLEGHAEHEQDAVPEEPGAEWTPYDLDEQNAALEAIEERALAALEATKPEGV